MRAILLKRQRERISLKEYEEAEFAEFMRSADDHENKNDVQTRIIQGIQKIKDAQSKPSDQMPADFKRYID
jgi:hypothetical protein